MIIPALDISERTVVQLFEGQKGPSVGDPLILAEQLTLVGDIAVFDFDLSLTVAKYYRLLRARVSNVRASYVFLRENHLTKKLYLKLSINFLAVWEAEFEIYQPLNSGSIPGLGRVCKFIEKKFL